MQGEFTLANIKKAEDFRGTNPFSGGWFAGNNGESCTTVCQNNGHACDPDHATIRSQADMETIGTATGVYDGAGCGSYQDGGSRTPPYAGMTSWYRTGSAASSKMCYFGTNQDKQSCTAFSTNNDGQFCYCRDAGASLPSPPSSGMNGVPPFMRTKISWAPVGDSKNAWMQVGNDHDGSRLCGLHREIHGTTEGPSWGMKDSVVLEDRSEVLCCMSTGSERKFLSLKGNSNPIRGHSNDYRKTLQCESSQISHDVRCCTDNVGKGSNWISLDGIIFSTKTSGKCVFFHELCLGVFFSTMNNIL